MSPYINLRDLATAKCETCGLKYNYSSAGSCGHEGGALPKAGGYHDCPYCSMPEDERNKYEIDEHGVAVRKTIIK